MGYVSLPEGNGRPKFVSNTRWAESVDPRPGGLESWIFQHDFSMPKKDLKVSLMGKPWFSLRNPTPRCFFAKFWGLLWQKKYRGMES